MYLNHALAALQPEIAGRIRKDYGLLMRLKTYFATAVITEHPEAVLDHLLMKLIIEHLGEKIWNQLSLPKNDYYMRGLKSTMCTVLGQGRLPEARDLAYIKKLMY